MISLLANSRAACPTAGLTAAQYRALSQSPGQYFSEKERRFTFLPTPYGLSALKDCGLVISSDELSSMAERWNNYINSKGQPRSKYGNVINKDPWQHQDEAIDHGVKCPSPYQDVVCGGGKSLITVATTAACNHRRTLILCPKTVVNVWPREYRKHSKGDFIVVPLDQASTKKKIENARKWMAANPTEKLVFVNNYESAIQKDFEDWATSFRWDCVVADEAHRIKSPTGAASKMCASLKKVHPIGLSGTFLPHSPLDCFAQYRFLDPAIFGTSLTTFKRKYCKIGYFNEIESFINLEEMSEKINLLRHHVDSSVLSLPPVTHCELTFPLSPVIRKAYDRFKKELIAEIQGGVLTADNVLVRSVRLQQLTSGFFIDDNTSDVVVLDDRPKAAAFADWLDGVPRHKKAVVFCRFKHDIDIVKQVIEKDGRVYGELSGRRNDLTSDATFPPGVDVLAANISSGGVGVDLTAACYGCYYSISHNRGEYDQSIARLDRPGQLDHVTFSHLIAEDTIDPEIYEAFEQGRDLVQAVLGGLKCSKK